MEKIRFKDVNDILPVQSSEALAIMLGSFLATSTLLTIPVCSVSFLTRDPIIIIYNYNNNNNKLLVNYDVTKIGIPYRYCLICGARNDGCLRPPLDLKDGILMTTQNVVVFAFTVNVP